MSQDTDRIRARLEERLESLRERLAEMNQTLREPEDDDFEEQAADLDDDDVLESASRAGRAALQLIQAALRRLDEGTYGICVACGRPIEERRLQAIPEAENCLACADRADKRR